MSAKQLGNIWLVNVLICATAWANEGQPAIVTLTGDWQVQVSIAPGRLI